MYRRLRKNEGINASALKGVFHVRTVQTYIAFSPDTPDSVIDAWQRALDAMKSDGYLCGDRAAVRHGRYRIGSSPCIG